MSETPEQLKNFEDGIDYGEVQQLKDLETQFSREQLEGVVKENAKENLKDIMSNIKDNIDVNLKDHLESSPSDLAVFQLYAKLQGWYSGKVDGVWGPNSESAFESFEKSNENSSDKEKLLGLFQSSGVDTGSKLLTIIEGNNEQFSNIESLSTEESNNFHKNILNTYENITVGSVEDLGSFIESSVILQENGVNFSYSGFESGKTIHETEIQKIKDFKEKIQSEDITFEQKDVFLSQIQELVGDIETLNSNQLQETNNLISSIENSVNNLQEIINNSSDITDETIESVIKNYEEYKLPTKNGSDIELSKEKEELGEFSTETRLVKENIPFDIKVGGSRNTNADTFSFDLNLENKENNVVSYIDNNNSSNGDIYYYQDGEIHFLRLGFDNKKGTVESTKKASMSADNLGISQNSSEQEIISKIQSNINYLGEGVFSRNSSYENYTYNLDGQNVGIFEDRVDEVKEALGGDVREDILSLSLREYISLNQTSMRIGEVDVDGTGNGNYIGKLVVDGINIEKIKEIYNKYESYGLSPYVLESGLKDIENLQNIDTSKKDSVLGWISDIDRNNNINNNSEIFGEAQIFNILKESLDKNSESEFYNKLLEIAKIGNNQYLANSNLSNKEDFINYNKENPLVKQMFWKGLNRLQDVNGLREYFNGEKNLSELLANQVDYMDNQISKLLELQFGENYKEKFDSSISSKASDLYNKLPDDLKETINPTDLENKIRLASINFLLVGEAKNGNTNNIQYGGAGIGATFDIDSIIDNISLGYGSVNGKQGLGLFLGKELFGNQQGKYEFSSYAGVGGDLSNGAVVPIVGVGNSYDFGQTELDNWNESTPILSAGIFGGYAGAAFGGAGVGYEHSTIEALQKKESLIENYGQEIFSIISTNPDISTEEIVSQLDVDSSSQNMIDRLVSDISYIYDIFNLNNLSEEKKNLIWEKAIRTGLLDEYKRVLVSSNEGVEASGISIGFAGIPLIGAKIESISKGFDTSGNGFEVAEKMEMIEGGYLGKEEQINNLQGLESYFSEEFINVEEINGKNFLTMDLSNLNLPNGGYIIGVDPSLKIQKLGEKLYLSGNLSQAGNISRADVSDTQGKFNILSLGQDGISGAKAHNMITLNPDGNYDLSGDLEYVEAESNLDWGLSFETQGSDLENMMAKENEKLESLSENGVFNTIDNLVNSKLWNYTEIHESYPELVNLVRNGNIQEAYDFILNNFIGEDASMAGIFEEVGDVQLVQDLRDEMKSYSSDSIEAKFIVDRFTQNLFKDNYLVEKRNSYGGDIENFISNFESSLGELGIEVHENHFILPSSMGGGNVPKADMFYLSEKLRSNGSVSLAADAEKYYFVNMGLKDLDTINLLDNSDYNRTGGFLRAFRDTYIGEKYQNQPEDTRFQLQIKGDDVERVMSQGFNQSEVPEYAPESFSEDMNSVINAKNNYMQAFENEKSYSTVYTNSIIGVPFTYKYDAIGEDGAVPMYGKTGVVDKNSDGHFDENDYEKVSESLQMKEMMFNLIPENVKNQIKEKLLERTGSGDIDLKEEFLKKDIIDYDIVYYKWGNGFNDALGLANLQIMGDQAIIGSDGNIMIGNSVEDKSKRYNIGIGYNETESGDSAQGEAQGTTEGDEDSGEGNGSF